MSDARSQRIGSAAALIFAWLVVIAVFLAGPVRVGFLSDDYGLIRAAASRPWYAGLEEHHAATILSPLFKATAEGLIGRPVWVLLAFLGHATNVLLAWLIVTRRFKAAWPQALAIAAMFAFGAAGFEALAWSCALGYVLVTAVLLLGVYLILGPGERSGRALPWVLAVLQVVALAIWDWGALFGPLVGLCWLLNAGREKRWRDHARKALRLLGPMAGTWLLVMLVRRALGNMGYGEAASPLKAAAWVLGAPLVALYPNGQAAFYSSAAGAGIALVLLAVLGGLALVDRQVRLLLAVFFLCQLPYVLLGFPQSRYFYVGVFFLYAAVVLGTRRIPWPAARVAVLAILIGLHGWWSWQRATLWTGAFREAQRIRAAVDEMAKQRVAPGIPEAPATVLVNLPDRYGPGEMIWRPVVWRNGWNAFKTPFVAVNVEGPNFIFAGSQIPMLTREQVWERYADRTILEVKNREPGDWREFTVERWAAPGRSSP